MYNRFSNILKRRSPDHDFSSQNLVEVVKGGADFFSLLNELISEATESIHLQTYVFSNDSTGQQVAGSLMAAAKRGVSVYLMADGYASKALPKDFIKTMEDAGVNFRFFEPIFRSEHFYFGRRLHHKVAVFDNKYGLVSGSNIADRYNDLPNLPAWFDMAVFVEGDAAVELFDICFKIWDRDKGMRNVLRKKLADLFSYISKDEAVGVRVLQNDWVRRKLEIYFSYHKLFKQSKKSITIVCSYFLPGISLRNRLSKAVERGVDVKVVLANVSDVKITKHAERYLYSWMLRNGIKVYEYLPTVLHAKVAVVDGEFLNLGSYNINDLSAQASIELNLLVRDHELAEEVQKEIEEIISTKCEKIEAADYSFNLLSFKQLWRFLCYHAIRLTLTIGTFYFKQEE
jgi:cardiolipin synthase